MTAIAALELERVPILLSDFLITTDGGGTSLNLHTRPNMPSPPGAHRIADLRRKCVIVNDRFVVAFTGNTSAGRRIIRELVSRFSQAKQGPTLRQINRVLHPFTFNLNSTDCIIGWTVHDRRPVCFSFTAKLRSEVKRVDRAIMGTGAPTIRKYLDVAQPLAFASLRTARERAISKAIAIIGQQITEEMMDGQPIVDRFGGGAEVVAWNGRRFEFVPKIAFFFWNVTINENHRVTVEPSGIDTVYEDKGKYAIFCSFTHQARRTASPDTIITETTASYLAGLLPLHEDFPLYLNSGDEPDYTAPYYFSGFSIYLKSSCKHAIAGASYPATDHPLFSLIRNEYGYNKRVHKEGLLTIIRSVDPEAVWN